MTYHWVKCCLMCFIAIVKPFFTHWFDYGLFRLPDQDYGLTAGVTGQQGMLTPPRHLIPPLVCPEVRDCPTLVFVFCLGLTRLITVRYLCLYMRKGPLWANFSKLTFWWIMINNNVGKPHTKFGSNIQHTYWDISDQRWRKYLNNVIKVTLQKWR